MMEWVVLMVAFIVLVTIFNLFILIACFMLYTEMFKQIAQEKR